MPAVRRGLHRTAVIIAVSIATCADGSIHGAGLTQSGRQVAPPTAEQLGSATYSGLDHLGPVTLVGGAWTGSPSVADGATRPVVELADAVPVAGDLDGDRIDETVVVLTYKPGGSAVFSLLAVLSHTNGGLRNVATTSIGDRVQIRSVRIEGGTLLTSVVRAGADDAACCPGEIATWKWRLDNGRLTALGAETTGRLSLDTLSGTVWVLRAWDVGEPASPEPIVSLAYERGRVVGSSGCNRYFAEVASGSAPGELKVGPMAGTRMACPDSQSSVEARFLDQLGRARFVGFRLGRLAVTYVTDTGATGVMLFEAGN